jgi:hypothetical protein
MALYKYLRSQYVDSVVGRGQVRFSSCRTSVIMKKRHQGVIARKALDFSNRR